MKSRCFQRTSLAFEPVAIGTCPKSVRLISSVHDAANYLLEEWPAEPEEVFRTAVAACRDTFGGRTDTAFARTAFLKAADRAGILQQVTVGNSADESRDYAALR